MSEKVEKQHEIPPQLVKKLQEKHEEEEIDKEVVRDEKIEENLLEESKQVTKPNEEQLEKSEQTQKSALVEEELEKENKSELETDTALNLENKPDSMQSATLTEQSDKKPDMEAGKDLNMDDWEYKYDEAKKTWRLVSTTTDDYYTWCEESQEWQPKSADYVTETEHYRWHAEKQVWVPKTQVPTPEDCQEVDEEGHKIYKDKDGTTFFWDEDKKAWFPKIDVDMLLRYQMNYVFNETADDTASSKVETRPISQKIVEKTADESKANTADGASKKRTAASWFEIDPEHNTKVYVSNLPLDITLDEFAELMGKCGMINRDADTSKLKLKLYTNANGEVKGDGICDYIKMESVQLALNILDEYVHRGHKLSVAQAQFKMRGDYNPSLKPKKRKSDKAKQRKMKEKLFDWRPERMRGERGKHERVVIIKNYFHPSLFEKEVDLLLEYQNNLREECKKCGTVNKVTLYDRHEEGVAQVNMSSPEEADLIIQMMHGRLFGNRKLTAEHWDGKTKYKSFETETDEQKRLSTWQEYLDSEDQQKTAEEKTTKESMNDQEKIKKESAENQQKTVEDAQNAEKAGVEDQENNKKENTDDQEASSKSQETARMESTVDQEKRKEYSSEDQEKTQQEDSTIVEEKI